MSCPDRRNNLSIKCSLHMITQSWQKWTEVKRISVNGQRICQGFESEWLNERTQRWLSFLSLKAVKIDVVRGLRIWMMWWKLFPKGRQGINILFKERWIIGLGACQWLSKVSDVIQQFIRLRALHVEVLRLYIVSPVWVIKNNKYYTIVRCTI